MSNLTAAFSAAAIENVFKVVVDNARFEKTGRSGTGLVTLSYDVALHFPDDATAHPFFALRDDGSLYLHDLEIFWDKLELTVGVSIPQVCVGGDCILPNPFGGCLVNLPQLCLFGGHPDFSFTLKLDQFVTSKVLTIEGGFQTVHWTNPARQPGDTDWDAYQNNRANEWRLGLQRPRIVDVAPIDVGDTVANLFQKAVEDGVASLLGDLPGWAKDAIMFILGGVETVIRDVLGLGENIALWIENQLNVPGSLLGLIETAIADYFANQVAITITQDPHAIPLSDDPRPAFLRSGGSPLIPVMVPIASLQVQVNSKELVLEGSVG